MLFEPLFGGLRVNVCTPSIAHWKASGQLPICHLSANFRWKGMSPTNHCWCQKTREIALLCGIKISAVHRLVLSQNTHVTDRQNYDSQGSLA